MTKDETKDLMVTMLAYTLGFTIDSKRKPDGHWAPISSPNWNFINFHYRVRPPEPAHEPWTEPTEEYKLEVMKAAMIGEDIQYRFDPKNKWSTAMLPLELAWVWDTCQYRIANDTDIDDKECC